MRDKRDISIPEWDETLNYLALIIESYGDQFWPLFVIIEAEYEKAIEQNKKLRSRIANFKPTRRTKPSPSKTIIYESV